MGCATSSAQQQTHVHTYPNINNEQTEPSGDEKKAAGDSPTYLTPLSTGPSSDNLIPGETPSDPSNFTPAPIDEPEVVAEDDVIRKPLDDRDVILDDGETVGPGTNNKPLLTNKLKNSQLSEMGREVRVLDCLSNHSDNDVRERPDVPTGELWVDPVFPKEIAMGGLGVDVKWLRPKDIVGQPCLYADGTCRYDIEQGAAGTCWFLAILTSLADKPEYMGQIIPENAYKIGTDDYDGVFHCRFWRFGRWEDVYIDDLLPVQYGQPWGARSRTDKNEMWISLIEKAFAKFFGSYKGCWGGVAGRAFEALTGGVCEFIELEKVVPRELFRRMRNSLVSGSILACSIPTDTANLNGLTGKHAYTITGVCKVPYRGKYQALIHIRNPWGGAKGEWRGAWSDDADEWKSISAADKAEINVGGGADGEFWISLVDFFQYYGSLSICNFTPDIDHDGNTDGLSKVWSVFGEWVGESAASWQNNRMKNPKYTITIPEKGCNKEGVMSVVIQFIQDRKDRSSTEDQLNVRTDVYKLEEDVRDGDTSCWLLKDTTRYTKYWGAETRTYRYQLDPGRYLLLPHYSQPPGREKRFVIRIFTPVDIDCAEPPSNLACFVSSLAPSFDYKGKQQNTKIEKHMFGMWKAGKNAGGQMGHRSVDINPQYSFKSQGVHQPVSIALVQEQRTDILPIGIGLFKCDHKNQPLTTDWIYSHVKKAESSVTNEEYVFMNHHEVKASYMLSGGEYVLLIHTNHPGQETRYFVTIATKVDTNCRQFNVCS